ncbi:MAG: hypothetical protein H6731_02395 [Myxococcales bacterium]|nr:MAG: hypothetical protein H6731_02395 [Myxococcales bacterium]
MELTVHSKSFVLIALLILVCGCDYSLRPHRVTGDSLSDKSFKSGGLSQPSTPLRQRSKKSKCDFVKQKECELWSYSCAWNVDVCMERWSSELPDLPVKLKKVKQIKADDYVCVIDKQDELWCMHRRGGKYEILPHETRKFIHVETQGDRVCGVLKGGEGICFTEGKKDPIPTFSKKLLKLYPFGKNICGIYQDGKVFCDGDNQRITEIAGMAPKNLRALELAVNQDRLIEILYEDNWAGLYAYESSGWRRGGELGAGFAMFRVAASQKFDLTGLDRCYIIAGRQSLVCSGPHYKNGEMKIPKDVEKKPVKSVSVGFNHSCAILQDDDEARCWGWKSKGQLQIPANLKGVKSIVAGNEISCYITSESKAQCVGRGKGL